MKLLKNDKKTIVNVYMGHIASSDQGGGVNYVENLIRQQKNYYQKIYLLSVGTKRSQNIKIYGVNVKQYSITKTLNRLFFLIQLCYFLIKNKKKFTGHNFHIHTVFFAPVIKFIKPKKIIVTIHTKTYDIFRQNFSYLKGLVYLFLKIERLLIKYCIDEMTFSGRYIKNLYRFRFKNLKKRFLILPPASIFKRYKKINFFKKKDKKIILVVGRIASIKRPLTVINLFLNAIKKDKYIKNNFKLCFAGTGELFNTVKNYIKKNQLEKYVILKGNVKSYLMPKLYSSSHSILFLSKSESYGYVILESLLSGKPIFTTNVGIAKYVINKKNGVIIPISNPQKKLIEFISFLKKKYNLNTIINSSKKFIKKDENILKSNIKKIYK